MKSVMLVLWEMDIISKLPPCWHLNGVYILFMELNEKLWGFFFLFGILFSFSGGRIGERGRGGEGRGPACVILFRGSLKWPWRQLNIPFILFIKEIQSLKRWSNWLTGMTVKPTKFNLILSSTTYRAYKLSPSTRQPCSLHLIQMEMKPSVIVLSDFTISINPA